VIEDTLVASTRVGGFLEDIERIINGDFGLHWNGIHEMPIGTRAGKRTLAPRPATPKFDCCTLHASDGPGGRTKKFAFDGNPGA
jgi:hypothetical protein